MQTVTARRLASLFVLNRIKI